MRLFTCYTSIIAERDAGMLPERMDTSWGMGRVCAPWRWYDEGSVPVRRGAVRRLQP